MLYIIYPDTSLLTFLLEDVSKEKNCILIPLTAIGDYKLNLFQRFIYFLERKLLLCIYPRFRFKKKEIALIKMIQKDDKILIFDYPHYTDIKFIAKLSRNRNITSWLWNSYQNHYKYIKKIKELGIIQYSFDPVNAKEYNIGYLNQLYRSVKLTSEPIAFDFFFIGIDRNRAVVLEELAEELIKLGYSFNFLVKGKKSNINYALKNITWLQKQLPYSEILKKISQSRVLVDITQKNQTGITLRVLEGSFFNKKVITNNHKVKELDLYCPANIFILNERPIEELKKFIDTDYIPINPDILKKYSINEWIKTFI